MPSLGLSLGLGGVRVLGPTYDPDAAAWFDAVEATGATFGPDPATITANKTAWDDWVIAQKNAESPIAGRSNWDQLTEPDEGFIQPLMGLSTFNVPPLFGGRTFSGFVSGDYLPVIGLKGGTGRVLLANRDWDDTPQDDFSAGIWITEAAAISSTNRVLGPLNSAVNRGSVVILTDARTRGRFRTVEDSKGSAYDTGTFPRSAFMSRSASDEYDFHNGINYTISRASKLTLPADVTFFGTDTNDNFGDFRGGIAFYGRSINLAAMNTACVALSEAITWPT